MQMNRDALSASVIPTVASRRLTINLLIHDDGDIAVQSCEISADRFLNRTSFRGGGALSDVFVGKLASALHTCLSSLPRRAHMLSSPDFLLELPGLTLSGVRVMAAAPCNGVRSVIIRFKEFLGAFTRILKPAVGFEEALTTNTEKLALNALTDICVPIQNFVRSTELKDMDRDGRLQSMLEMKLREFEFHAELLKRYVSGNLSRHESALTDRREAQLTS